MYISESQLSSNTNLLSKLCFISEQANIHRIPVIESNDEYLINLDDIINFSEESNQPDHGKVLSQLCEANEIDPNNVSFIVQDWRLLEDASLQKLCQGLIENGVTCYIRPISENDQISLLMEDYIYNSSYSDFLTEGFLTKMKTDAMAAAGLSKDQIKTELEYGKVDWHNDEEAYKQLLKDAGGDQNLINTIKKMRSEGMKAGEIRSSAEFGENEKLHPRGKMDSTYLTFLHNPKNIKAMTKASGIYETRDRNMKRAGEWLSSKDARNNEASFNAAKQRTQRQLHRAHSHFDISKNRFDPDMSADKSGHADIRYHDFTGASDSEVTKRVSEIENLVKNEEFPKTKLAKIIAWLRSLYRKFMYRHHIYKSSDLDFGGAVKNIAARILLLIDKLAQKLQNKLNK